MTNKPLIPIQNALNWYIGNYIMSPNNALREDEALLDQAFAEMDNGSEAS